MKLHEVFVACSHVERVFVTGMGSAAVVWAARSLLPVMPHGCFVFVEVERQSVAGQDCQMFRRSVKVSLELGEDVGVSIFERVFAPLSLIPWQL